MAPKLPDEDTSKRKRFLKLRLKEVAGVTRGGHQDAHVLITRGEEREMTFMERVLNFLKTKDSQEEVKRNDGMTPQTTKEIIQSRKAREELYRIQGAFEESMYRILTCSKGKEQVKLLKNSVDEFGELMDGAFKEVGMERLADDDMSKIGSSITRVAEILSLKGEDDVLTQVEVEDITRSLDKKITQDTKNEEKKTMTTAIKVEDIERKLSPEEFKALKEKILADAPKVEAPKTATEIVQRAAEDGKLSPEVTAALAEINANLAKKDESIKVLVKRLDDAETASKEAAILAQAKEFVGLGMEEKEVVDVLRSGSESAIKVLRAAKARIEVANKALTEEHGYSGVFLRSAGQEDAYQEITRLAQEEMGKSPEKYASVAEARVAIRRARPDLVKREEEQTARA